ncbi:MAG TPA: toll/interleukin-1 receptor domain-containing protein [Steroidobacteraceae bacterium]|nr:toll/interleukin-1 receptor domain-containing protein [Steroidobacteraceae bacterium]
MAHDVFISYCTEDKPIADAVCATLEGQGTRCWIAPRDILPGTDWGEAIVDAINESKAMLLVFSSKANASQQIKREVERAVHRGIPLIPVRLDDALPSKSLEYFISTPHWLDALTPPLESHLQRVAQAVKALLQRLAGNAAGTGSAAGDANAGANAGSAAGNNAREEPRAQPKAASHFCIHCGARFAAGNRFCTGCGKPLTA